jgi:bifunctional DNA-binding transcriptional regulator/antitoxin component of YhaV-PrlF toxin-antitoxin module
MAMIKLTSKRQATFPAEVCNQLGVNPGDTIELRLVKLKNEHIWALYPIPRKKYAWIGSLKKYAKKAKHPWSRDTDGDQTMRTWAKENKP